MNLPHFKKNPTLLLIWVSSIHSSILWWICVSCKLNTVHKQKVVSYNSWVKAYVPPGTACMYYVTAVFQVNLDPAPIPDPGFWWPKIGKIHLKCFSFLGSKIAIYLSLGLHIGRPSYRRSLQLPKREHPALEKMKFLIFFFFCRSFLRSWIRIRIHWTDRIRIRSGSWSDPISFRSKLTKNFNHLLSANFRT